MTTSTEIESMTQEQRDVAFVRELTALTRKYKTAVASCGCCQSIWLEPLSEDNLQVEYGYGLRHRSPENMGANELRWKCPPETDDNEDQAKIVR